MEVRTGIKAEVPQLQTGGPKIAWESIPETIRAGILTLTASDCAFRIHPGYEKSYRVS